MQFDERTAPIFRNYSDLEEEVKIKCYSLEEILIEKMAALMGRTIPRDLYDFDYIVNEEGLSFEDVYIEFMSKAEKKGHDPKEFSKKVTAKKKTFNRDWQNSLQLGRKKASEAISIFAPDRPGIYEIVVQGYTKQGESCLGYITFDVVRDDY